MIPALAIVQEHIVSHMGEYITLAGALIIAAICCMPVKIPTSAQELWDWIRNTLQTATPATRAATAASSTHTTVSTPTSTVEQTKNESSKEN